MGSAVDASSVADFKQICDEAGSGLVVVHFWANWATQCQQMNDVLAELAKDTQFINSKFVKIEAENVPEVSQQYNITAVPTCILIRNKKEIDRVNGANAAELSKKVQQHGAPGAHVPPPSQPPKQDLNNRLKKLINQAPVMLFMKGVPEEPRCGFSRTMIGLLNEQKIKFSSFNILGNDDVRQGLKKYSNWPTYPQLYINGELVGGLDIVKEMAESGDLADMVPKEEKLEDKLKRLINEDKVMVFMKGNPGGPRCGFSKTLVGILSETGVPYKHFDILMDEEVRQGLKTYSNWPTYPQVYVNGEFIGGLDILKELKEAGELESALKGEQ